VIRGEKTKAAGKDSARMDDNKTGSPLSYLGYNDAATKY